MNLIYDVSFNKEVAKDVAIYWTEEYGLLEHIIEKCDELTIDQRYQMGLMARARVDEFYSWDLITDEYEELFLGKESEETD